MNKGAVVTKYCFILLHTNMVFVTPLCYRKISVCGFHFRKITFLIILRSLRNHEPIKMTFNETEFFSSFIIWRTPVL